MNYLNLINIIVLSTSLASNKIVTTAIVNLKKIIGYALIYCNLIFVTKNVKYRLKTCQWSMHYICFLYVEL